MLANVIPVDGFKYRPILVRGWPPRLFLDRSWGAEYPISEYPISEYPIWEYPISVYPMGRVDSII